MTTDKTRLSITLDTNVKSDFDVISTELGLKNNGEVLAELIKAYQENQQLKQQLENKTVGELSYTLLGLEAKEIEEVKNAEKVSNQTLKAIAKDGLLQKARYLNSTIGKINFENMTDEQLRKSTAMGTASTKIAPIIEKIKKHNDEQSDNSKRFFICPTLVFKLTNCNFKSINKHFETYRTMIDDANNKYGLSDKDNRKGKGFNFKSVLGIE